MPLCIRSNSKLSLQKCGKPDCSSVVYCKDGCISLWCKRHSCRLGPALCREKKRKSKDYCHLHRACDAQGCSVERDYKHTVSWCCPEHACRFDSPPGKRACTKKPAANSAYCGDHVQQSTCAWERCRLEKFPGSQFCLTHKCVVCSRGCYPGRDTGHCSQHQPCAAPTCTDFCAVGSDGEPQMCCPEHHVCSAPGRKCQEVVIKAQTCCQWHRCGVNGCKGSRDQFRGQRNLWCRDPSPGVPFSRNCVDHTCRQADCFGQAIDARGLCQQHCCRALGCNNQAATGNAYCGNHKCQDADCQLPAKMPGGYCTQHACVVEDCGGERAKSYRNMCPEHVYRAGRDDEFNERNHLEAQRMADEEERLAEQKRIKNEREEREMLAQYARAKEQEQREAAARQHRQQQRHWRAVPRPQAREDRAQQEADQRARLYQRLPTGGVRGW
ncbi:hypothetical protein BGZ61DRAFT_471516 [Ilyonectria robusta]|uniref:uncharacterized protein n=1 Tax=Ilyonectria robusta TaxID=1079257 RepID=UPI001E8D5DE8|nr:uncharacterized protein BGZ61DRAFT_471516 [Ilyonectria robusta]KAH8738168.1 hypothetical protein BGZ61DRAFT_471516 [Ilyonectria robusta]